MLKATLKTGNEALSFRGKSTRFVLHEFWQWSGSDLVSNATRGVFAEFIVAAALRLDLRTVRDEWQPYDLETLDGIKVEVKSSAYVQVWNQKAPSRISFSIRATRAWDSETNVQAKSPKRQADVYVFCLLKHRDKATIDPLNLDQWEFYILSTRQLEEHRRNQVSISLTSLQSLTEPVAFDKIEKVVSRKWRQ